MPTFKITCKLYFRCQMKQNNNNNPPNLSLSIVKFIDKVSYSLQIEFVNHFYAITLSVALFISPFSHFAISFLDLQLLKLINLFYVIYSFGDSNNNYLEGQQEIIKTPKSMTSGMGKSGKDIKGVLSSLKYIIEKESNSSQILRNQTMTADKNDHELQKIIGKMRTQRVREIFIDKLRRNNTHLKAFEYRIQSEKQKDDQRIFQAKGFRANQYFLSVVYIIDILFAFVTFVLGTFFAFFDQFRQGQQARSAVVVTLLVIAFCIAFLVMILMSTTQTIVDGMAYQFILDISLNNVLRAMFYINIAYIVIIILVLALVESNYSGLGVALFLISVLKILTLYENLRVIELNFINSFQKGQLFNLSKVIIFNIFFAHFITSILFVMSKLDIQKNWIRNKALENEIWYVQYFWGYYWACTIMMTVGFGDILPVTYRQAIIVAFIQLFSCIVLAYNISEIGSIITALRSVQAQYKRKHGIFKRMIKQDPIDEDLQKRIQNFLKSEVIIKQMFEFQQQAQLINQFPQGLRDQFITEVNKNIFPQVPFFNNLQKATLVKFTRCFKGGIFYPGQFLTKQEEALQEIVILKTGKVGLAYRKYGSIKNGSIVQELQIIKKSNFNLQNQAQQKNVPILLNTNFLSRTKIINYDIVAISYSFAYQLKIDDFCQAIKESQIDSSHFFYIRDKHPISQSQWENVECEYCPNRFHYKFTCPKLHYLPIKGIVILKNTKLVQYQQKRDEETSRKKVRSPSAFNYRREIFKPLQNSRNILVSNRFSKRPEKKEDRNNKLIHIFQQKTKLDNPVVKNAQENGHCNLHMSQIQKAIKTAIEQALTGYKSQFWNLEIDKMHNYSNYFSKNNPANLYFTQIKIWNERKASKSPAGQ